MHALTQTPFNHHKNPCVQGIKLLRPPDTHSQHEVTFCPPDSSPIWVSKEGHHRREPNKKKEEGLSERKDRSRCLFLACCLSPIPLMCHRRSVALEVRPFGKCVSADAREGQRTQEPECTDEYYEKTMAWMN